MIQVQFGDYRKYRELAIFLAWLIIKHSISYKYTLLSYVTFLHQRILPIKDRVIQQSNLTKQVAHS